MLDIYPVPPSSFCERLYGFDPDLFLNWDPAHKVWAIWRKDPIDHKTQHVLSVVDDDGSYRALDERVFTMLRANRWFAEHPKELEFKLIDEVEEQKRKEQKRSHDDLRHFAKDKTLNRQWNALVEKAQMVPWDSWTKPSKIGLQESGQPVFYKPHDSILLDKTKPVI